MADSVKDIVKNAEILLSTKRRQVFLKVIVVTVIGLLAIALVMLAVFLLETSINGTGVCYDPKLQLKTVTFQAGLQMRAAHGMSDKWQGMCATLKPEYNENAGMYTSSQVRMEPCDPANPAQLFMPSNPLLRPDGKKWYHVSNVELEATPEDGNLGTATWQLITPCAEAQSRADGSSCPPGGTCEIRFVQPQYYSSIGSLPCSIDPLSSTYTFTSSAAEFAFDKRDPAFPCAFFMGNINPNESLRPSRPPIALSPSPLAQPHGLLGPVVRESDGVVVWGSPSKHSWAWVNPRLRRSISGDINNNTSSGASSLPGDHCAGMSQEQCEALQKVMNDDSS